MGVVAERKRFTVDEYHKLGQAGVVGEDDRIELIDGELIQMPPIGSVHAGLVGRLDRAFQAHLAHGLVVWAQNPLSFPPASEPQPDLALLKPRSDDYLNSLPTADDVVLVIEGSDTTLAYDRDVKVPLYASQGIPECWLIDPRLEQADFYWLDERNRYLPAPMESPGIYRSRVLTSFWLRTDWLWQQPLPDPTTVLLQVDRMAYAAFLEQQLRATEP